MLSALSVSAGQQRRSRNADRLTCRNSLMAAFAAGVAKGLASFGHELPIVARGMKRQLEDPARVGVPDLAVGNDVAEVVVALAPGTHDELPDASIGVG